LKRKAQSTQSSFKDGQRGWPKKNQTLHATPSVKKPKKPKPFYILALIVVQGILEIFAAQNLSFVCSPVPPLRSQLCGFLYFIVNYLNNAMGPAD